MGHHIRAIERNKKGTETIERTGLDRPFIDEDRRDHYLIMKEIFQAAQKIGISTGKGRKLLGIIDTAAKPSSEYAGMIRWAIKNNFRY